MYEEKIREIELLAVQLRSLSIDLQFASECMESAAKELRCNNYKKCDNYITISIGYITKFKKEMGDILK